jgi:hypothetical protein
MQSVWSRGLSRRDAIAGAIMPFIVLRTSAAAELAGRVETLRGEASAQSGSATRPLTANATVFVGDLVATGDQSAVALHLGEATQVRLGAAARLRIDRFLVRAGIVLELAKGALLFDHDPAAPPAEAAVRSPFGLMAVRGTRFFAGPSNNVFGVFVFRGEVTVVGEHTSVLVQTGFGIDIAAPGAEPTAPHQWKPQRVQAAEASVS